MSIRTRVALVSIIPGAAAMALFYLAAFAQVPGDGRRLFWYASLCVLIGLVLSLGAWLSHCARLSKDKTEDAVADLRCGHRQHERRLSDLERAVGLLPVSPKPRLYAVPPAAAGD